ncbi:cytochrome b5 domain-containing protein [Candidatus Uhrbacteria bacterium]|nr:cytochrome b5 domain-containing protein [Candidatus Uhrbacteria bacterium]
MRKLMIVPAIFISLLGAGCAKVADTYPIKTEPAAQVSTSVTETPTETKTYVLEEVAAHATESDCWLAVDGKVYDVTKAVEKHPGGPAILKGCGKDATEMFKGVEKHGDKAREFLTGLYIGDLK